MLRIGYLMVGAPMLFKAAPSNWSRATIATFAGEVHFPQSEQKIPVRGHVRQGADYPARPMARALLVDVRLLMSRKGLRDAVPAARRD